MRAITAVAVADIDSGVVVVVLAIEGVSRAVRMLFHITGLAACTLLCLCLSLCLSLSLCGRLFRRGGRGSDGRDRYR